MIQKRLFLYSILILCLSSVQSFASDQNQEREKVIVKNYSSSGNDKLCIENVYGQIAINTWDKNEITVEITVKSSAKTETKSQEIIDGISISDTKAGNSIYLKTLTKHNVINSGKQSISIDYKVNMPASTQLNLLNKFGNIILPSLKSAVQATVNYGNLRAGKLTGDDKRLLVTFGSADIDELDNAFLESKYSKLNIDKIGKAEVLNSFGKTVIMEANNLRINQRYGDLDLRKVNVLNAQVEFSNLDIDVIGKSAELNLKYSGNADLGLITSSVELLKINASFSTVYMKFDETTSLDFNAHLKFGDIKVNNMYMKDYVKSADQSSNTADYKGKIGKGGGSLIMSSQYTTFYFK